MQVTEDRRPPFFAAVLATPAPGSRRAECAQVGPNCQSFEQALDLARQAHSVRTDPRAYAMVTLYERRAGLPEALIDFDLDGRPTFVGGVGPGAPRGYATWIATVNLRLAAAGQDPITEDREDLVSMVKRARQAFSHGVNATFFASQVLSGVKDTEEEVDGVTAKI